MVSGLLSLHLSTHAVAQEGAPRPRAEVAAPDEPVEPEAAPFRTGLEGTDSPPSPPGARVSFNLEDANLSDLVRIVSRITGKRFILSSSARAVKATVYSP